MAFRLFPDLTPQLDARSIRDGLQRRAQILEQSRGDSSAIVRRARSYFQQPWLSVNSISRRSRATKTTTTSSRRCDTRRDRGGGFDQRAATFRSRGAKGGQLEVLKWLRTNERPWDEKTCAFTAGGGTLETLRWARANGCPRSNDAFSLAATGGYLKILKWLRENGCPWD